MCVWSTKRLLWKLRTSGLVLHWKLDVNFATTLDVANKKASVTLKLAAVFCLFYLLCCCGSIFTPLDCFRASALKRDPEPLMCLPTPRLNVRGCQTKAQHQVGLDSPLPNDGFAVP